MTRKEALTDLLAKVDAGESDQAVLEASYGVAEMTGDIGRYVRIIDAFNGSIDAAKALHEAVLPGCEWGLGVDRHGPAAFVYPPYKGSLSARAESVARAWLAAILRALIAECEQEDAA